MSSDERLALRAAQGDERAFGEIYERYHQELYRFCLAMVGNPQDAQDALQNAMVKVLRALPGEKREIQLKPWLYRIARNESVEVLRRRRDSAELEPEQATTRGVAETAETRERLRTLLADLEQLPERQRAALLMRELSGLDFVEIGTAFGSSAAVARQTLYEARLSLRQLEAGREMRCGDVKRELSDADGRISRRRDIRAHLRACADCRAFRDEISKRQEDLAALSPLPVAAAAGLLHGLVGKAAGGSAGMASGGGISGAGVAGKAIATSAFVKAAATVAVVAVVGVSAAADRSGLIDLPVVNDGHGGAAQSDTEQHGAPAGGSAAGGSDPAAARLRATDRSAATGAFGSGGSEIPGNREKSGESGGAGGEVSRSGSQSSAQRGLVPPGGGYGRSASERHGRPEQAPEAAAHGHQTAQSHKPAHATSPASHSGSGSSPRGSSSGGGTTAAKPAPPPKAPPATHLTPPSEPPVETPAKSADGTANSGSDATPPRHEG